MLLYQSDDLSPWQRHVLCLLGGIAALRDYAPTYLTRVEKNQPGRGKDAQRRDRETRRYVLPRFTFPVIHLWKRRQPCTVMKLKDLPMLTCLQLNNWHFSLWCGVSRVLACLDLMGFAHRCQCILHEMQPPKSLPTSLLKCFQQNLFLNVSGAKAWSCLSSKRPFPV